MAARPRKQNKKTAPRRKGAATSSRAKKAAQKPPRKEPKPKAPTPTAPTPKAPLTTVVRGKLDRRRAPHPRAHRAATDFPLPDATPPMEAAQLRAAGATPPPVMARPALPIGGPDPDATPPPVPTQPVFTPPGATPAHNLSEPPPALPPPAPDLPDASPPPAPDATPPMGDSPGEFEAHATPPLLRDDEAILVVPPAAVDVRFAARSAVALVQSVETLEPGFTAWEELRSEQRRALQAIDEELRRIDEQGTLLLGAVRSALETQAHDSLATGAEQTLAAARAELTRQRQLAEAAVQEASETIRSHLLGRVARRAGLSSPKVRLMVRMLPDGRRILHLERPSPDDAVVLMHVLSGRIPSRFGYLFDDSTDDLARSTPLFFAEEGAEGEMRPPADVFQRQLDALFSVWPVKAVVPQFVDGLLVVWRSRGAVLEAELAEGPHFRNLLTEAEAERIVGRLFALKIEGRLDLELARG